MADHVVYAFFPDMHDPTIVFSGAQEALLEFSKLFTALSQDETDQVSLSLEHQPGFLSCRNTKIEIIVSKTLGGIRQILSATDKSSFEWKITKATCLLFADLIDKVSKSENPAHQYLESDSLDQVLVIVSKGEYDDVHGKMFLRGTTNGAS